MMITNMIRVLGISDWDEAEEQVEVDHDDDFGEPFPDPNFLTNSPPRFRTAF